MIDHYYVHFLSFSHEYLQFGSLEEFQEEFKDISQEEQISRLHRMLAPHLLRSKIDDFGFYFLV